MSKDKTPIEEVVELLEDLNKQSNIASFLKGVGCKGFMGEAHECPVARYLRKRTSRAWSVGETAISLMGWTDPIIYTPTNVRHFIQVFDGGKYPELVEGNEP